MRTKVFQTIEKYDMIPCGSRVVVALSGGSDSMSLLHILGELKDDLDISLEAAHVNHCLRGEDSDSDELFVRNYCSEHGIKLHVLKTDVAASAKETGESVEQAGRRIRYDFFSSVGDDVIIATAHNLSDRIETFFFNFARGSGLKGLCSIPAVRNNIVRPLVECSKEEIEKYCADNSVPYVTDKTNTDVAYSRNRIRHNVIPELKKINPGFEECAGRCIELLNKDEILLSDLSSACLKAAERENGYSVELLYSFAVPIRNRAISMIIESYFGITPERNDIMAVDEALSDYTENGNGRNIQLSGNCFLRTRAGVLELPGTEKSDSSPVILSIGKNAFGDYLIDMEKMDNETDCSQQICKDFAVSYIDGDKITGSIVARTRISEDTIKPCSRNVTKQLRKLQNELGIAPEVRNSAPVLADDYGLFYAFGCGIDERVRVSHNTHNLIKITVIRLGADHLDK